MLQRTVEKLDLSPVNPTAYDGSPDIADLPYLNEASVLHNLKTRYFESSIYVRFHPTFAKLPLFTFFEQTYSGLFLVAVNPYRSLPIYTLQLIEGAISRRSFETKSTIDKLRFQVTRTNEGMRMTLTSTQSQRRPGRI